MYVLYMLLFIFVIVCASLMRGRKSMDMSNCLFTSVFSLEIQLSKWKATTPLNSQTPPLVVHVQARILSSTLHVVLVVCVESFEMRGGCSIY